MVNFALYPSQGNLNISRSIKFEISGLEKKDYNIKIEDATHNNFLEIKETQYNKEENRIFGIFDLNLPENSLNQSISIFSHIEEKQKDNTFILKKICPSVFTLDSSTKKPSNNVSINPNFAGLNDLINIKTIGKPNSKRIFSLNDKIFNILLNKEGYGSFHFKGNTILENNISDKINKFVLYEMSGDNYTDKINTGINLHVIPQNITLHANIDPRCDPDSASYYAPGTWEKPEDCIVDPVAPIEKPLIATSQPIDYLSSCKEKNILLSDNICKIYGRSMTLLNNGTSLHAYLSPDNTYDDSSDPRYNVNKIYLNREKTSSDSRIIILDDIVVAPKGNTENFTLYVSDEVYNAISLTENSDTNSSDPTAGYLYVLLFNKGIGFHSIKIINKYIEEYTGLNIIVGEVGNTSIEISTWIFCVQAIFYYRGLDPSTYLPFFYLSYVQDNENNYLQIVNVDISSNIYYFSNNSEETYVYIVAEVMKDKKSQLFFYSFSLGRNSSFTTKTFGWKQLTENGNNSNPKIKTDKDNNLHIFWESDRCDIKQIYYGVLGTDYLSISSSAMSSCFDKYAKLYLEKDNYYDYVDKSFLINNSDEYLPIPQYSTGNLVSEYWDVYSDANGIVTETASSYLPNLTITGNALSDEAIAFSSLKIIQDDNNPSGLYPYSQFNYQLSFNLEASVTQTSSLVTDPIYNGVVITQKEIDVLYNNWKKTFTVTLDDTLRNRALYEKDGNFFTIGKQDNVFDRIVPFLGSYKKELIIDPYANHFSIKIMKNGNTLKDFVFALMLEKSYFHAENIESSYEFESHSYTDKSYISNITETIYTGRSKLCVLIKTDGNEDYNNYIIYREFPDILDMNLDKEFIILCNYAKINSDETNYILGTYKKNYDLSQGNKFIGALTLLINDEIKFSQSFISDFTETNNYFDIGFGIPYGGYYYCDKMPPSKLSVYDDVEVRFNFSDINITSPYYTNNNELINIPYTLYDFNILKYEEDEQDEIPEGLLKYEETDEEKDYFLSLKYKDKNKKIYYDEITASSLLFSKSYEVTNIIDKVILEFTNGSVSDSVSITDNLGNVIYENSITTNDETVTLEIDLVNDIDIVLDINSTVLDWSYVIYFIKKYNNNSFIQVPFTFAGTNQSVALDIGMNNDVNLAWESNRNKYWNIYHSSSCDKLHPYNYDLMITDMENNCLKPAISVNRNGTKLISWHDNREGNYNIYCAKSIDTGYCSEENCQYKLIDYYEDKISECSLILTFTTIDEGTYKISISLYEDNSLEYLYKTIELIDDNKDKWFINGNSIIPYLVYDDNDEILGVNLEGNTEIEINYNFDKDDAIYDRVLYAKINWEAVA